MKPGLTFLAWLVGGLAITAAVYAAVAPPACRDVQRIEVGGMLVAGC